MGRGRKGRKAVGERETKRYLEFSDMLCNISQARAQTPLTFFVSVYHTSMRLSILNFVWSKTAEMDNDTNRRTGGKWEI